MMKKDDVDSLIRVLKDHDIEEVSIKSNSNFGMEFQAFICDSFTGASIEFTEKMYNISKVVIYSGIKFELT